uniref:Fe2OG dioxygenase domain-containing protein n=1 Tax=Aegilops tauschii subsp. strangulata TaxID=200361 RepID=A0A453FPN6_AEGTS
PLHFLCSSVPQNLPDLTTLPPVCASRRARRSLLPPLFLPQRGAPWSSSSPSTPRSAASANPRAWSSPPAAGLSASSPDSPVASCTTVFVVDGGNTAIHLCLAAGLLEPSPFPHHTRCRRRLIAIALTIQRGVTATVLEHAAGTASPSSTSASSSTATPSNDLRRHASSARPAKTGASSWVINHGVPEALQEEVMEACKELYSLPRDEKADYIAAGPKDPIRIGTGLFYSDVDDAICRRDYMKMIAHPEFHCPAKPAKLRDIAVEYSARTRQLLLELAKAISESLGLDRGRISEVLNLESCFQILVGNNYPPYAGSDGVMGISAHSDHGLLTLLFQNGVDGLQVMHNGQWVTA